VGEVVNLDFVRVAKDLREMWQGRALAESRGRRIGLVVASALAHAYDIEHVLILMRSVFPGFEEVKAPQLCTCGKISKDGEIIADIAMEYAKSSEGQRFIKWREPRVPIYESLTAYETALRHYADELKLSDDDRVQFFIVMKNWVVADERLDPNMDPADPDAKRLTV
jgi:hypothetical protein